ncbi:hypothetical protein F4X86_02775 [Candidatus Saccharibacteria bacterium]|nr:hypothetical protein [Candidatus Saccharibacteria bacterium]
MRLLSFAVIRQDEGFYEVEIEVALGGDMSDLEFDNTVFRYTDNPGTCNPTTYTTRRDCETNGGIWTPGTLTDVDASAIPSTDTRVQWASDSCTLPAHITESDCSTAGGTWTGGPQNAGGYFNNLQTVQCQSGETFCALIEFKTKAFRRVF